MAFIKKQGGFSKPPFGARSSGPRKPFGPPAGGFTERFQATCSQCRAVCEVPFKPNGKKPIYCRDCFKGKEDAPRERASGGYRNEATGTSGLARQLDQLNLKLDRLIKAVEGGERPRR